jgi:CheY-like chemotaxis protein
MKKKILIVEDDLALRYMLQRSLNGLNLDIIAADNGRVALEIIRSDSSIVLIIADIVMPGMSGIEFRKQQLADGKLKHIPIVFLTGHLHHTATAQELDPFIVLTKPVMPEDFKQVVENALFYGET